MARRTKADALATREGILDAAERLFQARGVSRTSLHDIASEAGVTRGAVYWHFRDKGDLFNAMMERVREPLGALQCARPSPEEVLPRVRAHLLQALKRVAEDPQVRRVIEIATQKAEYVDDLCVVHQRHLQTVASHLSGLRACLDGLPGLPGAGARAHALGLHALVAGLIHTWLLDPSAFDLVGVGRRSIDAYLAGLDTLRGAVPARAPAGRRRREPPASMVAGRP